MDIVVEAIQTSLTSCFYLFQTYNPFLVISGVSFSIGLAFIVLSFARSLWNAHVTIRLGPIMMIGLAAVMAWWSLSDKARGILAEWVQRTPEQWHEMLFNDPNLE
jgi:hypothetical protein